MTDVKFFAAWGANIFLENERAVIMKVVKILFSLQSKTKLLFPLTSKWCMYVRTKPQCWNVAF